jgi:glucokinase
LLSAYGSEVGCAAIKWIPTGGLFVTGGLTPKNIKQIEGSDSEFMKAYYDKGRVSKILDNIPLFAVMVEDLGVR